MMRRPFARLLTLTITLSIWVVSGVLAAPIEQGRFGALESLSVYFPKDTMLYAATRTDANFIASLDRLAQTVGSQLPAGTIPAGFPATLTTALNLLTQQAAGGGTFANVVRPWLGDTLAVGVYPAIRSAGGRIVVKITDAQAATEAALKTLDGWSSRPADGYTLVVPTATTDHNRIAIYPDVMIIYSWSDDVGPQPVATVRPNVSANSYYRTALDRLPDANYDAIAFVDTPLMLAYDRRQNYPGNDWVVPAAILRTLGSAAVGIHIGTDETVTVDVAQTLGNTIGLDSLGVHFTGQGATLSPDILQHIPQSALLVIQAADLGSMLEFVGSGTQTAAKKFQVLMTSIITGVAYSNGASSAGLVSGGFAAIANSEWGDVFFSNLTGYDYHSEIRPLLGHNSVFFLSLNPAFRPNSSTFVNREPFDGALVLEATDAQAAQQFVTKLQRELAITAYSSGDQNAIRIQEATLPGGAVGISLSVYGETGQPFDQFIAAARDKWLVIGTTRVVNQILGGDGLGFNVNTNDMLLDAGVAMYANLPPAQSPEWTTFKQSDPGNLMLQLLPYFVQNLTFSMAGTAQNDLLMRLTVNVPCGDNCG